jgi:hypothetical protein
MTAEIDAGPIIYQSIFPVTEEDTGFSVSLRCIQEGIPLLSRLLAALEANPPNLPQTPQDPTQRHYLSREIPLPRDRYLTLSVLAISLPFCRLGAFPSRVEDNACLALSAQLEQEPQLMLSLAWLDA